MPRNAAALKGKGNELFKAGAMERYVLTGI